MITMGSRIKELRIKKGLTQEELADILGVNRVNISHYESGKISNIPSDKLDTLANTFNTTVDYLMGRSNFPGRIDEGVAHNDGEIPDWATSKDKRDFKRLLEEDEPVMFDGVPMSDEDKEKVKRVMEAIFWDAKAKNKVTYGRKKKKED